MDTDLAVTSKRDERRYADRPLPDDVVAHILDAGRIAGSAANKQARTFVVVEDAEARRRLAGSVYAPANLLGAALVVALVGRSGFDLGRAAQNMMLVAWNHGVTSCPNGVRDPDAATEAIGETPSFVLGFGYPDRPRNPESRSPEEWSARARRLSLEELVRRI